MKYFLLALPLMIGSQLAVGQTSKNYQCVHPVYDTVLKISDQGQKGSLVIGYVGNGVKVYKWGTFKIEKRVPGDCDGCVAYLSHFTNDAGKRRQLRVLLSPLNRATAARVQYKAQNTKEWSTWHSNLRCIDWSR